MTYEIKTTHYDGYAITERGGTRYIVSGALFDLDSKLFDEKRAMQARHFRQWVESGKNKCECGAMVRQPGLCLWCEKREMTPVEKRTARESRRMNYASAIVDNQLYEAIGLDYRTFVPELKARLQ